MSALAWTGIAVAGLFGLALAAFAVLVVVIGISSARSGAFRRPTSAAVEPPADLRRVGMVMRQMHVALTSAGFSPEEATRLVAESLRRPQ